MDSQRNRDLLISHAQIRAVWNMLPALDMTVVGIGTLEDSVFIERQVLSPEDYALLRRQGAVGEICGRYFDAKGRVRYGAPRSGHQRRTRFATEQHRSRGSHIRCQPQGGTHRSHARRSRSLTGHRRHRRPSACCPGPERIVIIYHVENTHMSRLNRRTLVAGAAAAGVAASTLGSMPPLILYALAQKQIINTFVTSGIKG